MSTQELLNTLSRYDSIRKVKNNRKRLSEIGLEKIDKTEYFIKWIKSRWKAAKRKSIDELKEIARLRRIKNREKLTKEDLIISLLKSESSALIKFKKI